MSAVDVRRARGSAAHAARTPFAVEKSPQVREHHSNGLLVGSA